MILYKKLTAEQILNVIAHQLQEQLPKEIQESDARIDVSFGENNCIEIYLMDIDTITDAAISN